VEIGESVRGRDVYIIQTGTKDVNNDVMEMLIMAYAFKTSSARKIIGVVPYLAYSKQSKMRKRGCIVAKLLAQMMTISGFSHILTMDLHQKEVQGFFNCPIDNLRASNFLIEYITHSVPDYRNAVIVARHPGAVKRATSYAERLRLSIAVIHGEEKVSDSDLDDGRNSPPLNDMEKCTNSASLSLHLLPVVHPKEKPPINVVGDVGGHIAIVVDDMIDDVEAFVSVAQILHDRGAYKIYVVATHGLLSADAPRLIEDSHIDEVVVTNTVPHEVQKMQCHKIKTVDISTMLSEAIRRIHNQESMSHLFQNISSED
jgi:ribose-phosphate pyrophosphokinase